MPATVNGKELHLDFGVVAPEHLLDVSSGGEGCQPTSCWPIP
ncbi:MAG TPA: hypothetical protein VF756_01235 [Thermoanaerobaculia bacterium]